MKKIDRPGTFLVDNGILFEINRQVLHPLGMQLDFIYGEDGEVDGLELLDDRDSPDPIYFSESDYEAGRKRYERYMESAGKRNIQKRRRIGVVVQTTPTHVRPTIVTRKERGDG